MTTWRPYRSGTCRQPSSWGGRPNQCVVFAACPTSITGAARRGWMGGQAGRQSSPSRPGWPQQKRSAAGRSRRPAACLPALPPRCPACPVAAAAHNCTMRAVALLGTHKAFDLKNADLTCANMRELSVYNIRWVPAVVLCGRWEPEPEHRRLTESGGDGRRAERWGEAGRMEQAERKSVGLRHQSSPLPAAAQPPTPASRPCPAGACLPTAARSTWTCGTSLWARRRPGGGSPMLPMTSSPAPPKQAAAGGTSSPACVPGPGWALPHMCMHVHTFRHTPARVPRLHATHHTVLLSLPQPLFAGRPLLAG